MKKIFLGGPGSCDVHFDKCMIYEFLELYHTEYELTEKNPTGRSCCYH